MIQAAIIFILACYGSVMLLSEWYRASLIESRKSYTVRLYPHYSANILDIVLLDPITGDGIAKVMKFETQQDILKIEQYYEGLGHVVRIYSQGKPPENEGIVISQDDTVQPHRAIRSNYTPQDVDRILRRISSQYQ